MSRGFERKVARCRNSAAAGGAGRAAPQLSGGEYQAMAAIVFSLHLRIDFLVY
jgi:hypothetical protein